MISSLALFSCIGSELENVTAETPEEEEEQERRLLVLVIVRSGGRQRRDEDLREEQGVEGADEKVLIEITVFLGDRSAMVSEEEKKAIGVDVASRSAISAISWRSK